MYGLPHQPRATLRVRSGLRQNLRPKRIALFGYAHVPWFKRRQRLIDATALPGANERFDQAELAARHAQ
jgi:oxygen-independent coproporphyrinogen-3 oxidase